MIDELVDQPDKDKIKWYAEYFREAAKGWGLGAIMILILFISIIHFIYTFGGRLIDAKIESDVANAKTMAAVAIAVDRLSEAVASFPEFQYNVIEDHAKQYEYLEESKKDRIEHIADTKQQLSSIQTLLTTVQDTSSKQISLLENILIQLKKNNGEDP